MNETAAVRALALRVAIGDNPILRGLSFDVQAGERVALLGPNGAGKTTLLRLLAGSLRPQSGELEVLGLDPARDGQRLRARVGVLSHRTHLYDELTVLENLRLYAALFDVDSSGRRIAALLEQLGLEERGQQRVDSLSRGLQQRVAVARALLHEPDLLLLDEPDTGLDLPAFRMLESLLLDGSTGRTIVMATHNLDAARRICGRGLVLVAGRLVSAEPLDRLETGRLGELYRPPTATLRAG